MINLNGGGDSVWQTHDLWRLHVFTVNGTRGSVDGDLNESEAGSDIG